VLLNKEEDRIISRSSRAMQLPCQI